MERKQPSFLDSKKQELKEKEISWRGTLGFDFIFINDGFDKDGKQKVRPVCVELNGSNSGIAGVSTITKKEIPYLERLFARMRGRANAKIFKKYYLYSDLIENFLDINNQPQTHEEMFESGSGFSPDGWETAKEYIRKVFDKAKDLPLFEGANKNPEPVKQVCTNKNLQDEFIPIENRAAKYLPGIHEKSSTGYWIVKPCDGLQGKGIQIFTDEELANFLKKETIVYKFHYQSVKKENSSEKLEQAEMAAHDFERKMLLRDINVTEMLKAQGAQAASDEFRNNPASMRLLLDFSVTKDGQILIEQGFAYQRVSPNPNSLIVNKSSGAKSYPASQVEKDLALQVAEEIIHNLNKKLFNDQTEQIKETRVLDTVSQDI